jgi:ATP-dependent RNA helicase DDX10/DBP4
MSESNTQLNRRQRRQNAANTTSRRGRGGGGRGRGGRGRGGGSRGRGGPPHRRKKWNALDRDQREIDELEKRVHAEAPAPGTNPLAEDLNRKRKHAELEAVSKAASKAASKASSSSSSSSSQSEQKDKAEKGVNPRLFSTLALSQRTLKALERKKFTRMTDIQRAAIPHALAGRDVLGAARTGSGKTIAFLVPILEILYRNGWNQMDGLGALIISPTRELAMQIFEVLRDIGCNHEISAGIVIGGKFLDTEQARIGGMNILVATPGRLLQHMEQTRHFDTSNLKVLVLDEADRILDMGFQETLNGILDALPKERQTLLFSATQTKSVKSLARLSLKQPEYISVHESDEISTPRMLTQHYMVMDAPKKFDLMYSFIRTHLRSKTIVFVSSCKQVRYLWEMYRRMQPGISLMALHGKMNQMKRMDIYYKFLESPDAVLFATDIAARGLDFPNVNWVVQFDCPDTPETYIHRVGRTARYRSAGHALMILQPSEIAMVAQLKSRRVPLSKVKPDASKWQPVSQRFGSFLAEDNNLKYLAQKAFISYVRSVYLMSDKTVFDVSKLPTKELAAAMGLPGAPRIKFLKRRHKQKNMPHKLRDVLHPEQKSSSTSTLGMSRVERLLKRKNANVLASERERLRADDDDDSEDELLTVRKVHDPAQESFVELSKEEFSKMSRKQRRLYRNMIKQRTGEDIGGSDEEVETAEAGTVGLEELAEYQKKITAEVDMHDVSDKIRDRERVREMHRQARYERRGMPTHLRAAAATLSAAVPEQQDTSDDENDDESNVSGSEQEESPPARKKRKTRATIDDQEALALKLLGAE